MTSRERNPAIGIDLGTTNCCVAVMTRGKIKIIPNEQGKRVTPSYVSFTDHEQLIGCAAKVDLLPKSTIFDVKRLIGREWTDVAVQGDIENWPFKLANINNSPHIEIEIKGETKLFLPEQISAMLLGKLKQIAENYLKRTVNSAVITVPAYFNDSQRQSTIDAGRIAGLTVLKIINEPTSAAIAYAFQNHDIINEGTNILVFDLGGGTFDVTILRIEKDYVTVKATNGNTSMGGEDFDCRLVDYCVEAFDRKYNHNLRDDVTAIRRLRSECEKAKKELSHALVTKVAVYHIYKDIDFSIEISRARFEQINGDVIRRTLEPVEQALKDANMSKTEIHQVILVGGYKISNIICSINDKLCLFDSRSTRIPMLKSLLKDYFGSNKINDTINVDTTVAYGAAVEAAVLTQKIVPVGGRILRDVTPLSLGTDSELPPTMSVIIPRNTLIPTAKTVTYSTVKDYQKNIYIQIRQGESSNAHENYLIGKFELTGFPLCRKGEPWIDVTFGINENGILTASAVDKTTGSTNSIKIDKCSGRLKKEKIDELIKEAKSYQRANQKTAYAKQAAIALEAECFSIKRKLNDHELGETQKSKVIKKVDEILSWIDDNPTESESVYRGRKKEIKEYSQTVLDKYKSQRKSK